MPYNKSNNKILKMYVHMQEYTYKNIRYRNSVKTYMCRKYDENYNLNV